MTDAAYDMNVLEHCAQRLLDEGRHQDALTVYYAMADGDPSIEAGYLGLRIAECYLSLDQPFAAKYWLGRAYEENPRIYPDCRERSEALGDYPVTTLISPEDVERARL